MKARLIIIAFGITFLLLFWLKGCKEAPTTIPMLEDGQQAKVVIDNNKITVLKRGEALHTDYMPENSVIVFNEDGTVEVKVKTHGLTFQPGFGIGVGADDFRAAIDFKWAYWNRLGAYAGVNGRLRKDMNQIRPRGFVGIGYVLPYEHFENTSFVLAIDHKKDVYGYVRVGF